jgi:preprotein translocase subunit SecA
MAGRGTDIKLGEGVAALGGLYVIGTERHESRRIDNQLRGRSGRQGDPGRSQFYVSLDDDLLRIFGSDRMRSMMDRLGLPDDQAIENGFITKSLEGAQKKVEGNNFDIRKHVVEYDDVMNKHRETIYRKRRNILEMWEADVASLKKVSEGADPTTLEWKLREHVLQMVDAEIEQYVSAHTMGEKESAWDFEEIAEVTKSLFAVPKDLHVALTELRKQSRGDAEARTKIIEYIFDLAKSTYEAKEKEVGVGPMREIERAVLLRTIDTLWIDHLYDMEHLREGVRLQGYGQRDPLVEYKREGYRLFQQLLGEIQKGVVTTVFKVQIVRQETASPMENKRLATNTSEDAAQSKPEAKKETLGRNDLCWCGSGKKYKKCHGK